MLFLFKLFIIWIKYYKDYQALRAEIRIQKSQFRVANAAIFPLQDILGYGGDTKMNTPSTVEGNWEWRYRPDVLSEGLSGHFKYLTYLYGRKPV